MEGVANGSSTATGRAALSAALLARAERNRTIGDAPAAREAVTAAIPIDPSPAARYCYADLLSESGDIPRAISQLEVAWEHARRINSPMWRARCCHALAEMYRECGQSNVADRFRQLAIRAELDADAPVDLAAWLHDRATDALSRGDVDDAGSLLETAARVVPRGTAEEGGLLLSRGTLCVRQGLWSKGLRWFVKAFHALRRSGDMRGCARSVLNVGFVLQMRGEWKKASACFERASQLLSRLQADQDAKFADRCRQECARMLAAVYGDPLRN